MDTALVFKALGDQTRLEMVERLAAMASASVGALSTGLGLSRQGARKHLQVLADAGIVTLEPRGREVVVHLDKQVVGASSAYLAQLEKAWDARLVRLREVSEGVRHSD